ncbi:MAG: hypothetical protein HY917_04570 [Candidatus Diapherotrites archaeon]|nr:hypothetical protein [Candidatus Diapherotrites archaeon]
MGTEQAWKKFPDETTIPTRPRPYINHSVSFKKPVRVTERWKALQKAGLNVFFFPSKLINGADMLSDWVPGSLVSKPHSQNSSTERTCFPTPAPRP